MGVKDERPVLHSNHSLVTHGSTGVFAASHGSDLQILSTRRACSQVWTYWAWRLEQHASLL